MSSATRKHAANRPRARVSRLSDAQLLDLMSYLHAPERPRSTMPVDAAHGAICAVACAPFAISPAKWLPAILGEGHVFPSVEKEREITALLMRLYESTLHELARGPRLAIVASDSSGTTGLREWAEGYLIGVALSDPPWHDLVRAEEDFACLMFPFFVLADRQDEIDGEVGLRRMSEQEKSKLSREIGACLGAHLVRTYDYWGRSRRSPDAGSLH